MIELLPSQIAAALGVPVLESTSQAVVRRVHTDSRTVAPGDLFIALRGERFDGHDHIGQAVERGAVACLCEIGWYERHAGEVRVPVFAVADAVAGLTRLARWYRREVMPVSTMVVAVTGSNGKTTTKRMIDHVLSESLAGRCSPKSFNNHLGVPLTLLSAERGDQYLVVEIGSNAPGEVAALAAIAAPDVGVVTSIGEAHLEGLGSVAGIVTEKLSLLDHVRKQGLAVVNDDRRETRAGLAGRGVPRVLTVGFSESARLRVQSLECGIGGNVFLLDNRFRVELGMPGVHHASNAAATFAVARWFGLATETIIDRLRTFRAVDGRTCVVDVAGVHLVDDTYNANPASMAAAVESLRRVSGGRRVFVMGDMFELGAEEDGWHQRLMRTAAESGIEVLVVVGPRSVRAAACITEAARRTRMVTCADAGAASTALLDLLTAGDTVWLKASRAMALDRTVAYLQSHLGRRAAVA